MKKNTFILKLIATLVCGFTAPLAAANNNCLTQENECEWTCGDGKITAGADWLFFKIQQDGMNIGSIETTSAVNATIAKEDFSLVNPNYKYHTGYRLHLGYELPCESFQVDVIYTHLPTHARTTKFSSSNINTSEFIPNVEDFPMLGYKKTFSFNKANVVSSSNVVTSKWSAELNNIDVDVIRTIFFGDCLSLKPHMGFRAMWMDQKLRANQSLSETQTLDGITSTEAVTSQAVLKERFKGLGIEGGLYIDWNMGCGFSLLGHFGGSVLYTKISSLGEANIQSSILNDTPVTTRHSKNTVRTGIPTLDYFVGLQYTDHVCEMLVSGVVGWEQHVLFEANRLSANRGNLITQGLTLGLKVGF